MKNLKCILLFLVFVPMYIFSQVSNPCQNSMWTHDLILNNPSSQYPPSHFIGKKLIFGYGFKIDSPINIIDCEVVVNADDGRIKYENAASTITIRNSVICNGAFRAPGWPSTPTNVNFDIEGTTFFDGGEIFHLNGEGFRFVNNTVNDDSFTEIGPASHVIHYYKNLDSNKDYSFYGNTFNIPNFAAISITDDPGINVIIGDDTKEKNVFNCGIAIWSTARSLKVKNSDINYSVIGIRERGSKFSIANISNCKLNRTSHFQFSGLLDLSGISSKNTLYVDNCIFSNDQFIGISSATGTFYIKNSTFSNNNIGVKTSHANHISAYGYIVNNTFLDNNIDLFTTGSVVAGMDIQGNIFSGREFGVLADGDNTNNIQSNSFYNSYAGVVLYDNGSYPNYVEKNQFNTLIGLQSLEDNSGFEFLDNCFNSQGGDAYLDGKVANQMGSEGAEAGNCFTKNGVPDITSNTNIFDYYRPDSKIGTCNDPETQSSYTEINAIDNPEAFCGSSYSFNDTIRNYCRFNSKKITCIEAKRLLKEISEDIIYITNSSGYHPEIKIKILDGLKICRSKLWKILAGCPEEPNPFPQDTLKASNELKNSENKYDNAAYVGINIDLGNIEVASNYMLSMANLDEEMTDFVNTQFVNIRRYGSGDNFEPTTEELNLLYTNGVKSYPLAAYSRGLYTQLTGEIIYPTIPRHSFNRNMNYKDISELFNIFPNPTIDELKINSVNYNIIDRIEIVNAMGKVILKENCNKPEVIINTSLWNVGIYFINITDVQGFTQTKKLFKK